MVVKCGKRACAEPLDRWQRSSSAGKPVYLLKAIKAWSPLIFDDNDSKDQTMVEKVVGAIKWNIHPKGRLIEIVFKEGGKQLLPLFVHSELYPFGIIQSLFVAQDPEPWPYPIEADLTQSESDVSSMNLTAPTSPTTTNDSVVINTQIDLGVTPSQIWTNLDDHTITTPSKSISLPTSVPDFKNVTQVLIKTPKPKFSSLKSTQIHKRRKSCRRLITSAKDIDGRENNEGTKVRRIDNEGSLDTASSGLRIFFSTFIAPFSSVSTEDFLFIFFRLHWWCQSGSPVPCSTTVAAAKLAESM